MKLCTIVKFPQECNKKVQPSCKLPKKNKNMSERQFKHRHVTCISKENTQEPFLYLVWLQKPSVVHLTSAGRCAEATIESYSTRQLSMVTSAWTQSTWKLHSGMGVRGINHRNLSFPEEWLKHRRINVGRWPVKFWDNMINQQKFIFILKSHIYRLHLFLQKQVKLMVVKT